MEKTREYWLEQAELATKYAHARPACDLKGFFAALYDAEQFRVNASKCAEAA
jgi:hypothetical protein